MSTSCTNRLLANCDLMEMQSNCFQDQRLKLPFILTPAMRPEASTLYAVRLTTLHYSLKQWFSSNRPREGDRLDRLDYCCSLTDLMIFESRHAALM